MGSKANKDSTKVDETQEILKTNSLEDVSWLCSLSESEIDMLISLKMLAVQHAKMMGYEELARKFDLKMIRALGLVLMEDLKEKVKVKSLVQGLHDSTNLIGCSNLLKLDDDHILEEEEIRECIGADIRKRRARRRPKDEAVKIQRGEGCI